MSTESETKEGPGFPVKFIGVDKLHAAFLKESRTRCRFLGQRTGNPGCPWSILLILWSGGISYVRPFLRNGRVKFNFLVYTISKNALPYPNQIL